MVSPILLQAEMSLWKKVSLYPKGLELACQLMVFNTIFVGYTNERSHKGMKPASIFKCVCKAPTQFTRSAWPKKGFQTSSCCYFVSLHQMASKRSSVDGKEDRGASRYVYLYLHTHIYILSIYIHIHIYTWTCVCVYIYIHKHTYTYIQRESYY